MFIEAGELYEMLGRVGVAVLDVRRFDEYVRWHIPGSTWLYFWDLTLYEKGMPSTPKPREEVAGIFGKAGVGDGDLVVLVYDRGSLLYAAYTAWFLEYVGHDRYQILKGGFEAWISAGLPVERGLRKAESKMFTVKRGPDVRATIDDVVEAVTGRRASTLLDVRTREEHVGSIATTHRAGRIPRSTLLEQDLVLKAFEGDEEALKRVREIAGSSGEIVLYCTSGERASLAWLVLRRILGIPSVKLFPEGFLEYSKRGNLPVEVGEPIARAGIPTIRVDRNKLCEQGLTNPLKSLLEAISKLNAGERLVVELNDADWILTLKKLAETRGFKVVELGVLEDGFTRIIVEKPRG